MGSENEVRVPHGGSVVWLDTCCVCSAPSPEARVRLEAFAFRWTVPDTWMLPVQVHEAPLCAGCRRRHAIWWSVRGVAVLSGFAAVTFGICTGEWRDLAQFGLFPMVAILGVTLGPLVLVLWRLFPIGPTIRFADGCAVMRFRNTEFARAARVFDSPSIATVSPGPLAGRELEGVDYAGEEVESDLLDPMGVGEERAARVATTADPAGGRPRGSQRPARRRLAVASALFVTAALGLLSRRYPLPGFLAEHTGDAAYATAAFFLFALLCPRALTATLLMLAFGFAAAVEASQLLAWPWLQDLRATRLGGLLLGHGYQAADLVAHAVGALLAGCADVTFLRPSLPSPSGPDSFPDRSSRPTSGSGPAVHSENPR